MTDTKEIALQIACCHLVSVTDSKPVRIPVPCSNPSPLSSIRFKTMEDRDQDRAIADDFTVMMNKAVKLCVLKGVSMNEYRLALNEARKLEYGQRNRIACDSGFLTEIMSIELFFNSVLGS
jgi:hypothetical protein